MVVLLVLATVLSYLLIGFVVCRYSFYLHWKNGGGSLSSYAYDSNWDTGAYFAGWLWPVAAWFCFVWHIRILLRNRTGIPTRYYFIGGKVGKHLRAEVRETQRIVRQARSWPEKMKGEDFISPPSTHTKPIPIPTKYEVDP